MWIRLRGQEMEIVAPCGCLQSFRVTPEFEIDGSALPSRCGKVSCDYNYRELLTVAQRVMACLRKAQPYEPDLATVSASSYDLGGW